MHSLPAGKQGLRSKFTCQRNASLADSIHCSYRSAASTSRQLCFQSKVHKLLETKKDCLACCHWGWRDLMHLTSVRYKLTVYSQVEDKHKGSQQCACSNVNGGMQPHVHSSQPHPRNPDSSAKVQCNCPVSRDQVLV